MAYLIVRVDFFLQYRANVTAGLMCEPVNGAAKIIAKKKKIPNLIPSP